MFFSATVAECNSLSITSYNGNTEKHSARIIHGKYVKMKPSPSLTAQWVTEINKKTLLFFSLFFF